MHVDEIVDVFFAGPADAEFFAGETPRAVGGDDISRAKLRDLAADMVLQRAGHATGFLPQVGQFGVELDATGRQRFGVTAQHWLQHILRAAAVQHRRHRLPGRRCPARRQTVDFLAGQAFRPEDHAAESRRHSRGADVVFDAHLPVHFHGARIDAAGLGRDRRTRMAFDHDVTDAVCESAIDAVNPTGPAPTTRTSVSIMRASLTDPKRMASASPAIFICVMVGRITCQY